MVEVAFYLGAASVVGITISVLILLLTRPDKSKTKDLEEIAPDAVYDVRIQKVLIAISVTAGLTAAILHILIGSRTVENASSMTIITLSTHIASWAYLAILTLLLVISTRHNVIFRLTCHVAFLTMLNFGLSLVMCSDDIEPLSFTHSIPNILGRTDVILGITMTVASFVVTVAAINIPKAPPLELDGRAQIGVASCTLWSHLWFTYTNQIQAKSRKERTLELSDLDALPAAWRGSVLLAEFVKTRNNDWTLLRRLFFVFKGPLVMSWVAGVLVGFLAYVPAFFLLKVLDFIAEYRVRAGDFQPRSIYPGLGYVAGMFVAKQLSAFLQSQILYITACIVLVSVKGSINLEIYDKTLRKQNTAGAVEKQEESELEPVESGKEATKDTEPEVLGSSKQNVMNLMTIDADRITNSLHWSYLIIQGSIEVVLSLVFLYQLVGWAALPGFVVMCLFIPLTAKASSIYSSTQDKLMASRDKRVGKANEILQAIRQIKFQSNEAYFKKKTHDLRDQELHQLTVSYIAYVAISFCYDVAPTAITVVTFGVYAVFIADLTPAIAFTTLVIVNQMRFSLNVVPEIVIECISAWTSLKRVSAYLETEEIGSDVLVPIDKSSDTKPIVLDDATIAFASSKDKPDAFRLRGISAQFPVGQLSLITGPTGGGKTLLLSGMLGEACVEEGNIDVVRSASETSPELRFIPPERWILPNTFAYVAQSPWLENKSIQDNITFGAPLVAERYEETLTVCALRADLAILEDGDQTEIGEKGINLSGGQKARVALARAVYSRASSVVMDDVLSALDAHISKYVFDNCINGKIMENRTRILVTHQVSLCLEASAYVLALDEGTIKHVGEVSALQRSGSLQNLVKDTEGNNEEITKEAKEEEAIEPTTKPSTEVKKTPRKLVDEEAKFKGNVSLRCYLRYLRSQGNLVFASLIVILFIMQYILTTYGAYWIRSWSAAQGSVKGRSFSIFREEYQFQFVTSTANHIHTEHSLKYWIGLYLLISLMSQITGLTSLAMVFWGTIHAGRKLYAQLLDTVMRAPLRFLDTVPTGRLLNRFAKDTEAIDAEVGRAFAHALSTAIHLIFIVGICIVIQPLFLLAAVILVGIGLWIGLQYVSATRALKRLNSVNRSPVYETFSVTLSGITTIRAYGCGRRFLEGMFIKVNNVTSTTFYNMAVNRWLSIRFDTVGNIYTVGMATFILFQIDRIDAGLAGFTLSFALELQEALLYCIRFFSMLEQEMNSVERVFEYIDIPTEPAYESEAGKGPPAAWPTEGVIEFDQLELKYAPELQSVLHKISFRINSQEKIGIIGRTGSGKTTITLALFRFLEATHGSISIDGLDIAKMGLHDLRSRLTIVPQEPTLFQGTLRSNLSEDASDEELFDVLRRVHLIEEHEAGTSTPASATKKNINVFENLETVVTESGSNFSAGQRQLLCLARALLRRTKIIVMDEATASVSTEIDALIQKTIRSEFVGSTVLTIAHRLDTIIDYDRILVLGEGKIVEFDTPAKLLQNAESQFSQMVKAAKLKI